MNEIEKSIREVQMQRRSHLAGLFSNAQDVMRSDDNVEKADNGEEDAVEKSDILDAISYSGDIKVSKTGKEIKEQVDNVVLPELRAKLEEKKNEATEKLKDCGVAPTDDIEPWWAGNTKIDVGFKRYNWDELYFDDRNDNEKFASSFQNDDAPKVNLPENKEQAKARREYNELVRCVSEITADIKACEILKQLKDGSNYELTPRQVIVLRF